MDTYTINLAEKPTEYGFMPTMKAYILEKSEYGPRPLVIVCPGGAYGFVCEGWEGERVAMAYAAAGFHTVVVDYCVSPHRHPLPIRSVAAAIASCRAHAQEWQVDSQKIAVCGFSAGGHLAASISTLWNAPEVFTEEEIASEIYKPNASILCYPVITSGDKAHKDSIKNLTGTADETDPLWELMSLENQVNDKTPPAFLWHTFEDEAVPVENSMYYAAALRRHNIPFELHIYPKGGHGMSLCTKEIPRTKSLLTRDYDWIHLSIDWLSGIFDLEK